MPTLYITKLFIIIIQLESGNQCQTVKINVYFYFSKPLYHQAAGVINGANINFYSDGCDISERILFSHIVNINMEKNKK